MVDDASYIAPSMLNNTVHNTIHPILKQQAAAANSLFTYIILHIPIRTVLLIAFSPLYQMITFNEKSYAHSQHLEYQSFFSSRIGKCLKASRLTVLPKLNAALLALIIASSQA